MIKLGQAQQQRASESTHLSDHFHGRVQRCIYDACYSEDPPDDGACRGQEMVPRLLHHIHQDLRRQLLVLCVVSTRHRDEIQGTSMLLKSACNLSFRLPVWSISVSHFTHLDG